MTASTIAEIYIEKDAIRVEIEIGVPDLEGFRDLLPDAIYEKLGVKGRRDRSVELPAQITVIESRVPRVHPIEP